MSFCQKANCLWLCNLINFKVKHRKYKLMDFPPCPLSPPSASLSLFYLLSLSLSVTNGTSHSPTALNGAPSPPNGFSNGPSSSSSSSLANQQLPPACGARQLSKLKRFLTTLQQFGNDISPEIGERVRTLVLGLVVSKKQWYNNCYLFLSLSVVYAWRVYYAQEWVTYAYTILAYTKSQLLPPELA